VSHDTRHLHFFPGGILLDGMKNLFVSVVVSVAMAASYGCGSSDGGNCGKVAPCGGDIVGDWTIVDGCLTFTGAGAAPLGDACPSALLDAAGVTVRGNVSYKTDLSFSGTYTMSGTMALNIPQSCLTIQGITLTCAQIDQSFKDQFAQSPDPSIQSVSCSGSSSCRCTFVMTPQTSSGAGTYTTSGTTVTENGTSTSGYCVQGSELYISDTGMSMGDLAVTGGLVLKK
jgi:hypothetical protein